MYFYDNSLTFYLEASISFCKNFFFSLGLQDFFHHIGLHELLFGILPTPYHFFNGPSLIRMRYGGVRMGCKADSALALVTYTNKGKEGKNPVKNRSILPFFKCKLNTEKLEENFPRVLRF